MSENLCTGTYHWGKPLTPVKTLARREREHDERGMTGPRSIRGRASGRQFDPHNAGGLIRQLSSERVRITSRGVDVVERHVSRFGPDRANAVMIERLRAIADKRIEPTRVDRGFYTHELREFVRYRILGYESGTPADPEAAHTLWNNAHTATLEDYAHGSLKFGGQSAIALRSGHARDTSHHHGASGRYAARTGAA